MRKLVYVPIIHTDPDLGKLAGEVEDRAKPAVGGINWQKHKEVVILYWQQIANYWQARNASGLKIFQDAMLADGEIGEKIVKSLAEKGSINYQIIEQLMEKGAELIRTEDPELLKEEYFLTSDLIKKRSTLGSLRALVRYKWRKNQLLKARDTYIVKRISENLKEGETGACFLGAFHQIVSSLPGDIEVTALKNPNKVKEYQQKYTSKKWEREVDKLGSYLTIPIELIPGENYG